MGATPHQPSSLLSPAKGRWNTCTEKVKCQSCHGHSPPVTRLSPFCSFFASHGIPRELWRLPECVQRRRCGLLQLCWSCLWRLDWRSCCSGCSARMQYGARLVYGSLCCQVPRRRFDRNSSHRRLDGSGRRHRWRRPYFLDEVRLIACRSKTAVVNLIPM